jgi:hypothetical protein
MQGPLILVAVIAVLVAGLLVFGNRRWNRRIGDWRVRMEREMAAPPRTRYRAAEELAGLPPVVQGYFRAALRDGAPIVTAAELRHRGTFNMGEDVDRWAPFSSRQWVVTNRPGFVWDGRVAGPAWLLVHVLDAYVSGVGALCPSVAGLFTLEDLHDRESLAVGELMRWLAEAVWYPTALLPSQGVRWFPISGSTARASIGDGPHVVSLTFVFGTDGLVESVHSEGRPRLVRGATMPTPWEGRFSQYQERDGMQVPSSGEVAWLLPAGRRVYWRGTLHSVSYTIVPQSRDPGGARTPA